MRAFTLIELLVVITIIVVLLSLLTPALDKAIYEAEMAVDGTQLRTMGTGVLQYAFENRRNYPYRSSVDFGDSNFGNQAVTLTFWRGANRFDDRPQLEGYVGLGHNSPLNCPFVEGIDIAGSDEDTWIMSPYALYFGWVFTQPSGSKSGGMKRLGSRLTFTVPDPNDSTRVKVDRYRLLGGDDDLHTTDTAFSTHPDKNGVLSQIHLQDEGASGLGTSLKSTLVRWQGPAARGDLDNNFTFDDGSTSRFNDIGVNEWAEDERFGRVPYTWKTPDNVTFFRQIPKAE